MPKEKKRIRIPISDSKSSKKRVKIQVKSPDDELLEMLKKQLEQERILKEKYFKSLQYLQADYENFKKSSLRYAKEQIDKYKEETVLELIGILEDLERTLEFGNVNNSQDVIVEGVNIIYKKFVKLLERFGVETIEALNKPFDPRYHEAVSVIKTKEYPNNVVIKELRKGYLFNGNVLRPSLVVVSSNSDDEDQKNDRSKKEEEVEVA